MSFVSSVVAVELVANECIVINGTDGRAQFGDNVWPDSSSAAGQQYPGDGTRQRRPMSCCRKRHHSRMSYVHFTWYFRAFLYSVVPDTKIRSVEHGICPIAMLNVTN